MEEPELLEVEAVRVLDRNETTSPPNPKKRGRPTLDGDESNSKKRKYDKKQQQESNQFRFTKEVTDKFLELASKENLSHSALLEKLISNYLDKPSEDLDDSIVGKLTQQQSSKEILAFASENDYIKQTSSINYPSLQGKYFLCLFSFSYANLLFRFRVILRNCCCRRRFLGL